MHGFQFSTTTLHAGTGYLGTDGYIQSFPLNFPSTVTRLVKVSTILKHQIGEFLDGGLLDRFTSSLVVELKTENMNLVTHSWTRLFFRFSGVGGLLRKVVYVEPFQRRFVEL